MKTSSEPLLATLLRYVVYATAFLPLVIFSEYLSPFHFGKVILFRSIIEISFILYVLLLLHEPSYFPRMNPILWSVLGFAGAFSLATVTSSVPWASLWGSLERMGGLFTFWHYVIFLFILLSVLRTRDQWRRYLDIMIFVALLSAFYGFGQKISTCDVNQTGLCQISSWFIGGGGRERIFGTIGNPALFAGYEIVNLFLALTLLIQPGNTVVWKRFYQSAVVFLTLAVVLTVVRGSLLGLGLGFIVFAWLYYLATRSVVAKRSLVVLGALGLLFSLILLTPIKNKPFIENSAFLGRLTDTSFEARTAKTRFWAWEAGFKGWKENPKTLVLGWGPENFNIPFSRHFNPLFFAGLGSETFFDRAHNMFVEVLVTMGILGLIAYSNIFVQLFRKLITLFRSSEPEKFYTLGLIPLLIAYLVHNSFIFDTSANFLVFFSILGFTIHLVFAANGEESPRRMIPLFLKSNSIRILFMLLLSSATLVLLYQTNIISAKANYAVTRAIVSGWNDDFTAAIGKYKEALAYDSFGKYEFRHRFAQYMIEKGMNSSPFYVQTALFTLEELKKNVAMNPLDYLPELYIARLYVVLGKGDPKSPYNDESLQHSMRALELSPTFVRTYYEVAQAYLNKKDFDQANTYFKRAFDLNPDVGVTSWYLGLVELERGNTKAGLDLIEYALSKNYSPRENDYLGLINYYLKESNYEKIAFIYEQVIRIAPENPQYRASLAFAYAKLGRIDEAVLMARRSAELDPSFEAEARAFVQSLGREF